MKIFHFGNKESNIVLIQMVYDHELEAIENEVALIKKLSQISDFHFIAVKVDNWNDDLSPWEAPAVFGNETFGGNAKKTLDTLLNEVINPLKHGGPADLKIYIGGYSLAGLFALWSVCKMDTFSQRDIVMSSAGDESISPVVLGNAASKSLFAGCVAASPSVWFPGFVDYISANEISADKIYLSLGKKEEKTRNPVMKQVGECIQIIYDMLNGKTNVVLEWNEGNHFQETDLRMAKGFAWILKK